MSIRQAWIWHWMEHATASGEIGRKQRGFTLVELMVVMAILLTIISIAVPMYHTAMVRAKESVLQSNLFTMRSVIDQYTYDKESPRRVSKIWSRRGICDRFRWTLLPSRRIHGRLSPTPDRVESPVSST